MANKYTTRVTNEDGVIKAWIDQDGQKCIMQTHRPGEEEGWATEADAQAWADGYAVELQTQYEASLADAALQKERAEAAHAANLAAIDTAAALKALVAHLANS